MPTTHTTLDQLPKWEAPFLERPTPLPMNRPSQLSDMSDLFDEQNFISLIQRVRSGNFSMEKSWIPSHRLRPPRAEDFSSITSREFPELRELGWEAVKKGLVAMVILAGGTSSRLAQNKIFLDVAPGKSLLYVKYMTAKGIADQRGMSMPLAIMASPFTATEVQEDLASHGIAEGRDYLLFEQPIAPRLTDKGEVVTYQGQVQYDVTGHGALFSAFQKSGVLKKFAQWGVRVVIQSNTDNPFIIMDASENNPLMACIGHHIKNRASITAQVVRKEPTQRGGVPLWYRGEEGSERLAIIEESQVDPSYYKDIHYQLPYFNPLTLFYDTSYLKRVDSSQLPIVVVRRVEGGPKTPFHFYRFETFSGSVTLSQNTTFLPDTIPGIFDAGMFTQLKSDDQIIPFRHQVRERLVNIFPEL